MRPSLADFATEHGLGPIEQSLRLGGRLRAEGSDELPVELCLGPNGVYLVAQQGRFIGRALDAGDPAVVRYERGSLRDRIVADHRELTVPTGKAAEARRLIALGRVRRSANGRGLGAHAWKPDRYLDAADPVLAELVPAVTAAGDVSIAVVRIAEAEIRSELGATVEESTYLLLSAERVRLLRVSELGDHHLVELDGPQLRLEREGQSAALHDGKLRVELLTKSRPQVAELLELAALDPGERLSEAARRLWLAGDTDARATRPAELLRAASSRGFARAGLLSLLIEPKRGRGSASRDTLLTAIQALREAGTSSADAVDTYHRWQFSPELGRALVQELAVLGAEAEPWSLALHRAAFARSFNDPASDDSERSRIHAELAEHELAAGDPARARQLVESRLKSLPPDEDAVLAPERATAAHLERVRLYEALCREAEQQRRADVRSLAALARLEPTTEARLLALARANDPTVEGQRVSARAQHTLECLARGGLERGASEAPRTAPAPLVPAALTDRVRHPLARGGGRFATRLSELVAAVPEPDLGFLRDFCEELAESRHPDAARALLRATSLLGLPKVAAYVSHGARSVGMRAFGSREPFVLIGADHLVDGGPFRLAGAELDFALGAELSHLAFGHQRVTAGEVWAGAAGKTREALVLLGVVAPLLGDLGGPRARRFLERLSGEAIERAAARAAELPELFGRARGRDAPALGQKNEELIAAHRLVQLSADRAGLLAAGDIRPALRAVLVLRSDYREILLESAERGLLPALSARRAASAAFADLTVRVRALIAFYLSADFEALSG